MTSADQIMSSSSKPAPSGEMPGKLASSASVAQPFQQSISDAIAKRRENNQIIPKLVGILATPSPPSIAYAQWTKKACEQVGIEFEIWQTWAQKDENADEGEMQVDSVTNKPVAADTDLEADVEDLIIAANSDDSIHGIMIYYPIFGGRQDTYLQQIVDPRKDVEGLHFSYCFNMYHNIRWIAPTELGGAPGTSVEASAQASGNDEEVPPGYAKSILPCTPLAVVKCLETLGAYDKSLPYGDRLYGKVITVVNRSEVVGRPLAALLSNDGAKVYSADVDSIQEFNKRATQEGARKPSETVEMARQRIAARRLRPHHVVRPCSMALKECIAASDVVISGVPSSSFKIETSWIKEGAVTVNFSSEKNFEKDVRMRASIHLPAIGKTTIAMLQRNLLRLVEYREMALAKSTNNGQGGNGGHLGGGGADDPQTNGSHSERYSGDLQRGDGRDKETSATSKGNEKAENTTANEHDADFDDRQIEHRADDINEAEHNQSSSRVPSAGRSALLSRGRALTMMLPRSEYSHERENRQAIRIDPNAPYYASSRAPTAHWDWRNHSNDRRESLSSADTPPFGPARPSTGGQSSLLFAPIGSRPTSSSQTTSSRTSHIAPRPAHSRDSGSYQSASSPRSATPVSPLIIDGLSVEDSGSSVHMPGSQRPSWDSGPPRTPRDGPDVILPSQGLSGNGIPSVLERPADGHVASRYDHLQYSPTDEKGLPMSKSMHGETMPPRLGQDSRTMNQMQALQVGSPQVRPGMKLSDQAPPAQPQERIAHSRRRRRPPYSYSTLIAQAISSSPEGRMTLREIYTWISNQYPDLYSMEGSEGSGWQNTVRHNLSLNKCFIKVARTAQDIFESCSSGLPNLSQQARGKGGWWMLDPNVAPPSGGVGKAELDDIESSSTSTLRPPQRRRTSSLGMSMASDDEMAHAKSTAETSTPSVLQNHYTPQTTAHSVSSIDAGQSSVPSVFQAPARPRSVERSVSSSADVMSNGARAAARPIAGRSRSRGYTISAADFPATQEGSIDARHRHLATARAAHYGTPYTGGHALPATHHHNASGPPSLLPTPASRLAVSSSGLTPASRMLSLNNSSPGSAINALPSNVMSPNKRKSRYEEEAMTGRLGSSHVRDEQPLRSPVLGLSNMGAGGPSPARNASAHLPPLPPLHGRPASMSVSHSSTYLGGRGHAVYGSQARPNHLPPPPSPLSSVHSIPSQVSGVSVSSVRNGDDSHDDIEMRATDEFKTSSGNSSAASIPRSGAHPIAASMRTTSYQDDDGPGGSRMAIGGLLNS